MKSSTNTPRPVRFCLLVFAILLGSATPCVQAAVSIPYLDGFDYPASANLAGNGNWTAGAGSTQIKVGAARLSYPGLQSSTGNDVTLIPTSSSARTYVNFNGQSSGTIYFSFLLKINTLPNAQRLIAYAFNSSSSSSSPALGFFVNGSAQLLVGVGTGTPQFTSTALTTGSTCLVVVGYTFGTTDTADIWLNPTSLGGATPATVASISGSHASSLAYFHWNTPSTGTGGGAYEVDELRIGASYADVTPTGAAPPPGPIVAPHITHAHHTGTQIILHGTNGPTGGGYEILCTSNLALPLDQWSVVGSNNFTGAGDFDCTNPAPPEATQAFYRLRTGGGGATNPPAGTPPSINSQPQNQSAPLGQAALLSVGVTGSAPLSYQWYFNTNTPIASATNSSHLISSVSSNDAGAYHVIVANSAGSATSTVATLSITPAPTDGDWFVSTTGNDNNPGSLAQPFATVARATSVAGPGDVIYVRGGTYFPAQTIRITNSGTAGNLIKLWAYPGEKPLLDFTNQPYGASNRGFLLTTNGNYWHFKGLEIARAGDNAIKVESSHCIFELLTLHHNGDTGLQIGFAHETSNPGANLAAFIEVINCDSYSNYDSDSNGGDADGFAAKLHCGQGIIFSGCRAWENSDDAWDLFETDASVIITNCWGWKSGVGQGNGNGFKLGGDGTGGSSKGTHYAYNCVAFGHKVNGFTQNSHKDGLVVINCLSFSNGNSGYNYFMEGSLNSGKQNIFKNNASIPRTGTNGGGFIADNNPVEQNNSWNLPVTVNSADFVNLTEAAAAAPRNPDGTLPTSFARLVAGSDLIDKGVDAGISFNGVAPDVGAFEFAP